MPSITLSGLAYAPPGGNTLFADLDLVFNRERIGLVGRNGVGKSTLLHLIEGQVTPSTGRITVDGTLGVMRQMATISPGETVADLFGVRDALAVLCRAERGEATVEELSSADWSLENRIADALGRVGLDIAPDTTLIRLSGGQRTRASLAAALFEEPDFLILDEPTNNLDREGRAAVIALMSIWRAGAIVVSHDRELLEKVDAIVELTTLGATRFGGGWSAYRDRKEVELAAAEHDAAHAEKAMDEARKQARIAAERSDRRAAAGARKGARGDMPKIASGRRKQNAEVTRGSSRRLADARQEEAGATLAAARERIELVQAPSFPLPPTGLATDRRVLQLDDVTAGYSPGEVVIRRLSFTMVGPERVAVSGPNGSGKSTLLNLIAGRLRPVSGTVRVLVPAAMLDQQAGVLQSAASVLDNFRRLNPDATDNAGRATLARFLFRGDGALQTVSTLSGGQLLRAGLACILGGTIPPQLLILDEPTNHLDLDSIAAVESALKAYDGALLVVSHDEVFLEAIGITRRFDLTDRRRPL
jgi:ATPase subunit of ABC transporter with duplicated ATPase domains